jgi:hypothetical protein
VNVKWTLDGVRNGIRSLDPRVFIYKQERTMLNTLDKSLKRFGDETSAVDQGLDQ